MAPAQPHEPLQTLRHDQPPSQQPPGRSFSTQEDPFTKPNPSGSAHVHGHGDVHEGGSSGNGSYGWQPYEGRQSHFRPWIAKSNQVREAT